MKTLFLITLACLSYSLKAQVNANTRQDSTNTQGNVALQKPITIRLDGPRIQTEPPLVFLDGKEIAEKDMEKLDPDSIASIKILKDAKSLATYGEKGRHGVIIIERKKNRFKLE